MISYMTQDAHKPKIILLIGQTASGKTNTAINLAKAVNGEVISADSRQVYKGLNIGSDKITKGGMQGVSHHLIDIADPLTDTYTVSNFVRDASAAITDMTSRGKVPIVAGGTMLYIDALMGKVLVPEVAPNPTLRTKLEQRSPASLFEELQIKDPRRAAQMVAEGQNTNSRRLIRALEIIHAIDKVPEYTPANKNTIKTKQHPITKSHVGFGDWVQNITLNGVLYDVLWLGLTNDQEVQKEKINKRNAEMLESGLMEEVQQLKSAGITQKQFDTFGFEYKYPAMYLANIPIILDEPPTLEQVLMKMNSGTWRYAKKQRTWWQGRDEIEWFMASEYEDIENTVRKFLRNE